MTLPLATAVLLLVACVTALAADVSDLLKQGDAAFGRGELNLALRHYTSALDLDSSATLLYTKRAAVHLSLRQHASAMRDLNKALEIDSTFVQGYIHRGKIHRQTCNLAAAERDFQKVLELRPGHKAATTELHSTGRVRLLLEEVRESCAAKNVDAAKFALETLYADASDCVQAQVLEAKLYMESADYEQVVAVTGKVLKSEPSNLEALVLRGQAYFYLTDNDMAKRHFGEALKYDPDYQPARKQFNKVKDWDRKQQRADKAAASNDWREAEEEYIAALNVDADHRRGNVGLWLGLCRARGHNGHVDLAVEACDAVLILDPNNIDGKLLLVRTLLKAERWQEAVNKGREFMGQHQDNGELHHLLREAEKALKVSLRKDYYKILGVDKSAGDREIKRAYRDLAKQFHPDKVSAEDKKDAEAKFRDIAEAYEVLTDEEKRRRFDAGEDVEQPQGHPGHGHPFQHPGGFQFHFQYGG